MLNLNKSGYITISISKKLKKLLKAKFTVKNIRKLLKINCSKVHVEESEI